MNDMRKLIEAVEQAQTANPVDTVTVDIPLLIRLLEFSREDAQTDMDLHNLADNLINLSPEGNTLTMADYEELVMGLAQEPSVETYTESLKEDFSGPAFDTILYGYEVESDEEALDYARGMVWGEVDTTEQNIKYSKIVGMVDDITVYYDYGADYYFFAPELG